MLPREGRMEVDPHTLEGLIKLPSVSLPTEKGTVPATTLAVGPADHPINHLDITNLLYTALVPVMTASALGDKLDPFKTTSAL